MPLRQYRSVSNNGMDYLHASDMSVVSGEDTTASWAIRYPKVGMTGRRAGINLPS